MKIEVSCWLRWKGFHTVYMAKGKPEITSHLARFQHTCVNISLFCKVHLLVMLTQVARNSYIQKSVHNSSTHGVVLCSLRKLLSSPYSHWIFIGDGQYSTLPASVSRPLIWFCVSVSSASFLQTESMAYSVLYRPVLDAIPSHGPLWTFSLSWSC